MTFFLFLLFCFMLAFIFSGGHQGRANQAKAEEMLALTEDGTTDLLSALPDIQLLEQLEATLEAVQRDGASSVSGATLVLIYAEISKRWMDGVVETHARANGPDE